MILFQLFNQLLPVLNMRSKILGLKFVDAVNTFLLKNDEVCIRISSKLILEDDPKLTGLILHSNDLFVELLNGLSFIVVELYVRGTIFFLFVDAREFYVFGNESFFHLSEFGMLPGFDVGKEEDQKVLFIFSLLARFLQENPVTSGQ